MLDPDRLTPSAAPPWVGHRPRRSGDQRRAQYARAHARIVSGLLKSFAALQHRGCCNTQLGAALVHALGTAAPAAAAPPQAPARPPGIFVWEPIDFAKDITTYPLRATRIEECVDYAKDITTVPLRATRQPSVKAELFQVFKEEIDVCVVKGGKPRTHYEQQRQAKAFHAMEILNLCVTHAKANG